MKGTARRHADPADDAAAAAALAADAKQRAENLMIVDLLRNDLSRVAVPGSVAVPALVHARNLSDAAPADLDRHRDAGDPARDAVDVLAALFPCGSVTGAPKIRAMEIIAEVEPDARGPYTGSIG